MFKGLGFGVYGLVYLLERASSGFWEGGGEKSLCLIGFLASYGLGPRVSLRLQVCK